MKKYFSIYSGLCYEIPEDEAHLMDSGQLPLHEFPNNNCDHCYGKGYTVKDKDTNVYVLCRCMVKIVAIDLKNYHIENVRLHSQKNTL